ncbi:aminopeptidase [Pseudoxanthomonas broegbernensis]|uniref:Aminopeptidase n=1 Tax=Pseudoxanthomonas broegbernensis TaxID=83619 RepID=A0A7V8GNW8_9GAMM|nr:M1 family aminopeptidase [Pseudoxanthomonas broegbernensis]KAF1687338.1 aminopeptidase [Pseudoxanthomonas broegbernensis]MBB6065662.1 alanyl aminopeptidase [Pseudoxanthomonas broegbernensis]
MRHVLGLLLALTSVSVHAVPSDVPRGRLPGWAVPRHYALELKVDPRQDAFQGQARIELALEQPSDHVWLHGKDLEVSRVAAVTADGGRVPAQWRVADAQAGVARVDFGRRLPAQTLILELHYSAPLNRQLQGLYKVVHQGRAYAMTQMEPISARHAFPGFDEPAFKTPFDLSLTVPQDDVARANTAAVETRAAGPGWKTVRFATTLPLPTYLLAFGVGPWDVVDGPAIAPNRWRGQAVPLAGVAALGQGGRMQRALAQAPAMIEWLEAYFDYGYPFGKLDLVAAPDFSAGAMENPGFVTFRDWLLLLDGDSPARNVKGSFNVTAHELAHQWTGDVVTMAWWDDLWLNEAFATWLQQKITMALRPEYKAGLDRVGSAQRTMGGDSLVSARRIRQPITGNGDIETAFDGITYQKGAAVLAMFEAFVGPDAFRQGMRDYLRKHEFGNATALDLIDAIAAAAGKGEDFKAAFRSFLDQPGVPYLHARLAGADGQVRLELEQQRYLPVGSTGSAAQRWGVPVCVRYGAAGGARTACELVDEARGEIPLPGAAADTWVMPNAGGSGYYRFSLPRAQLARLAAQAPSLDEAEQLTYADALGAAFARGDADAADVIEGLRGLARSPSPEVATALLDRFNWIWTHLAADDAQRAALREAASAAFLPRLQALGYRRQPGEAMEDAELRVELAGLLGIRLELPQVRQALLAQAEAVLAGRDGALDFSAADPDLLGNVLAVAVQERGEPAVSRLIAALGRNGDAVQRNAMIAGLAMARDPAQLRRVRDLALGERVKVGEMAGLLMGGLGDPQIQRSLWPWFSAHFDRIVARTGVFAAGRLPMLGAAGGCSVAAAERLEAFFQPRLATLSGADRGLAQASESVRLCAALKAAQDPGAILR